MGTRTFRRLLLLFGLAALLVASSASSGMPGTYTVHKLSSNVPGAATHTDPDLVNGWGITLPPTIRGGCRTTARATTLYSANEAAARRQHVNGARPHGLQRRYRRRRQ